MVFIWTFLTLLWPRNWSMSLELLHVVGRVQHRLPLFQAWEMWLNPFPSLKTAQDLGVTNVHAGCHTKPSLNSWLFTAFPCESQPSRGTYQLDLTSVRNFWKRGVPKGLVKGLNTCQINQTIKMTRSPCELLPGFLLAWFLPLLPPDIRRQQASCTHTHIIIKNMRWGGGEGRRGICMPACVCVCVHYVCVCVCMNMCVVTL